MKKGVNPLSLSCGLPIITHGCLAVKGFKIKMVDDGYWLFSGFERGCWGFNDFCNEA